METLIQLYAKHVFNIPLPSSDKNIVAYCRECGGIIEDEGFKKKYSPGWASEGEIFNRYKLVCKACLKATQGSATKALVTPLQHRAVIIHKDGIFPERFLEMGDDKPKPKGTKDKIHEKSLTIKEAIEIIPELPTPYGIYCTMGDATKVANLFLKNVHLNYSNERCLLYVLPQGEHVEVRPKETLQLVDEIKNEMATLAEQYKKEKRKADPYYLFHRTTEKYAFSVVQKRLFNYLVFVKEDN